MKRLTDFFVPFGLLVAGLLVALDCSRERFAVHREQFLSDFRRSTEQRVQHFEQELARLHEELRSYSNSFEARSDVNALLKLLRDRRAFSAAGVSWGWFPAVRAVLRNNLETPPPGVRVLELSGGRLTSAKPQPVYFPLRNFGSESLSAISGVDLFSLLTVRGVREKAANEDEIVTITEIPLGANGWGKRTVLLASAILSSLNRDQPGRDVAGYLCVFFNPERVFETPTDSSTAPSFDLYALDRSARPRGAFLLYESQREASEGTRRANLEAARVHRVSWRRTLSRGPIAWELLAVPAQGEVPTEAKSMLSVTGWSILGITCAAAGLLLITRRQMKVLEEKLRQGEAEFMEERGRAMSANAAVREFEERCERLNVELSGLKREKVTFFTNLSHEIRTTLNTLSGVVELLLETPLTREQREYVEVFHTSANTLLKIVDDVLDLLRLEGGHSSLVRESFRVRDVVEKTLVSLEDTAIQKNVEFVTYVHEGVPDRILGDPERFQKIVYQLASNALRFVFRGGGVIVQVFHETVEEHRVVLRLTVSDTGVGVPPELQDRIFDAFFSADCATTRRYGASGLSLALASHLVRVMGGDIWCKSIPYRGSAYHVRLSFDIASETTEGEQGSESKAASKSDSIRPETSSPLYVMGEFANVQVLVAEDNCTNRQVITRLLRNFGCSVVPAVSGKDAVERALAMSFDIIFMDLQMPELDGYEATAKIRAHEEKVGRHVPIVALTAEAFSESRQECLKAGMDDFLAKPISRKELLQVLMKYVAGDRLSQGKTVTLFPAHP